MYFPFAVVLLSSSLFEGAMFGFDFRRSGGIRDSHRLMIYSEALDIGSSPARKVGDS